MEMQQARGEVIHPFSLCLFLLVLEPVRVRDVYYSLNTLNSIWDSNSFVTPIHPRVRSDVKDGIWNSRADCSLAVYWHRESDTIIKRRKNKTTFLTGNQEVKMLVDWLINLEAVHRLRWHVVSFSCSQCDVRVWETGGVTLIKVKPGMTLLVLCFFFWDSSMYS